MLFWFLAAAIPHQNLVAALDSDWELTSPVENNEINSGERNIASSNNLFDLGGIDIGDTTFASSNIFLNSEGGSDLFLNSEGTGTSFLDSETSIASSNLFSDAKEGTGIDEATIPSSDNFLNLNGDNNPWPDSFSGSSDDDDTSTFWTDEFLATDTSLQTSCTTRTDEFRLKARNGESSSCAAPAAAPQAPEVFQFPSSLQRLYEDPLGLIEDSLEPKKKDDDDPNRGGDDEPWIPRIYAEGDSVPDIPPPAVLRKLLIEDPCEWRIPKYRINLCCDGPAEESTDVELRAVYSIVYNCDPGMLLVSELFQSCCMYIHIVLNHHFCDPQLTVISCRCLPYLSEKTWDLLSHIRKWKKLNQRSF